MQFSIVVADHAPDKIDGQQSTSREWPTLLRKTLPWRWGPNRLADHAPDK